MRAVYTLESFLMPSVMDTGQHPLIVLEHLNFSILPAHRASLAKKAIDASSSRHVDGVDGVDEVDEVDGVQTGKLPTANMKSAYVWGSSSPGKTFGNVSTGRIFLASCRFGSRFLPKRRFTTSSLFNEELIPIWIFVSLSLFASYFSFCVSSFVLIMKSFPSSEFF